MKLHSIRRWLVLTGVIFAGIVISGLGFWLWDANNYPLPASLKVRTTPGGAPVTGIRMAILERRAQLSAWRAKRQRRSVLRNIDLGKKKWRYLVPRPDGPGTIRGTLEFQADEKAIFRPPIPPYADTLPGEVHFSRPRFDVVRLSWDRRQLDLEIADRGGGIWQLRGEWEGRPLVLWQYSNASQPPRRAATARRIK